MKLRYSTLGILELWCQKLEVGTAKGTWICGARFQRKGSWWNWGQESVWEFPEGLGLIDRLHMLRMRFLKPSTEQLLKD